jgi:hypothetical protein
MKIDLLTFYVSPNKHCIKYKLRLYNSFNYIYIYNKYVLWYA